MLVVGTFLLIYVINNILGGHFGLIELVGKIIGISTAIGGWSTY